MTKTFTVDKLGQKCQQKSKLFTAGRLGQKSQGNMPDVHRKTFLGI